MAAGGAFADAFERASATAREGASAATLVWIEGG